MGIDDSAALKEVAPVEGAAPENHWFVDSFIGWRFPTVVLSLVAGFTVLLLAVLFIPPSETALGAFAESFKIWCYGYDPVRGTIQWGYVIGMVAPLMIFSMFISGIWQQPLRAAWIQIRWGMMPSVGAGLLAATFIAGVLVVLGFSKATARGEASFPFPAEQLRTALPAPKFELENQDGNLVRLSQFEGKVTLVTAVYASCGYACPMIMAQTKRAVEALSPAERADLRVVAVTLDPEHDDRKMLAAMAQAQKVSAPEFNLLTGPPAEVNRVLDALQVARQRDPQTGIIEHVNLHILLDRRGKVAYRLTVGERQQEWLMSALKVLLKET